VNKYLLNHFYVPSLFDGSVGQFLNLINKFFVSSFSLPAYA